MKKNTLLVLFLFICHQIIAQKVFPEFGKINVDDLTLKSCAFETDAAAMKLFDIQEIEFDPFIYETRLKTERRVRIKVFNEAGYKYASIKIPYFSKKGLTKMKDLKGYVYNLDNTGKVIAQKLEKKDFFKDQLADNVGIINFTFPNLKPGSVIEFSYTKIEKNISQIDPWIVQDNIPVAYAGTTIIVPSQARIREIIYGTDTIPQTFEKIRGSRDKLTYVKEQISSFQYEPFMSSATDNLVRVVFLMTPRNNFISDALSSSDMLWKFFGSALLNAGYFGGQINKVIPGTEKLIDSAKAMASVDQKIKFIYEAVQRRAPDKPEQTATPHDIIDAWNNQDGNSAEINMMLLNLLQKIDVKAYPLLVSTRSHGKINTSFPSAGQFNGVDVVAVDSNRVYVMDASLKMQSYQNPPFNILNRQAFILDKDDMKWILVDDDRMLERNEITVAAGFGGDDCMEGRASLKYYDYAKTSFLDSSDNDQIEGKSLKKIEGLRILSEKLIQPQDDDKPVSQQIDFTYHPQKTDNFYFIRPQFLFEKKKNPFKNDNRKTDIDFGSNQQLTITLSIDIPPSYQIEFLPTSTIVRAPDSSFLFKQICTTDSSSIYFKQSFEIKRSVFYREEYAAVQEFFKRIYALMEEEIILKKKK